jgi:hypothetical protein
METNGGEPLVEALDDVEDEGAIGDVLAKISKILAHPFVAAAVLSNREVTLREGAGTPGLCKEHAPYDSQETGIRWRARGPKQRHHARRPCRRDRGDGAGEPSEDDAVHPDPIGRDGGGCVGEDVVF